MPRTVVLALGSNLGNRALNLRRALHEIGASARLVRLSSIVETEPVDAPAGSPRFLNMVAVGYTDVPAPDLLDRLLAIETALGRVRRGLRNAPRTIDLDLILYSGDVIRTPRLVVPHPRYRQRDFVMRPLREVFGVRRPQEAVSIISHDRFSVGIGCPIVRCSRSNAQFRCAQPREDKLPTPDATPRWIRGSRTRLR